MCEYLANIPTDNFTHNSSIIGATIHNSTGYKTKRIKCVPGEDFHDELSIIHALYILSILAASIRAVMEEVK
jgi:hypothetical protein